MFYRLKNDVALRKWRYVDRAIYIKGVDHALSVKKEEFELLLKCDGHHDLAKNEILDSLKVRHYIEECKEGEENDPWSKLKEYDNYYYPRINLMITGKCNLNCLHCFNAKDNAPLNTELSYEQIISILDQARDIGVIAFTLTGGEPLVHKRFLDIIRAIYERNMHVFELNTNGLLITQDMLDEFKRLGCDPLIKISFDGVGYHNWMRQNPKAEDKTVEAIKLCVKNGFKVKAQTQVHLKNLSSMMETAKLLDSIGVSEMRIIRTTEAPRWEATSPQTSIPLTDYYQVMLDFAKEYITSSLKMTVDIWQFIRLYPAYKMYSLVPISCTPKEFNIRIPMCKGNRGMIAISSGGEVVPCLQMSGYFIENNIHLGNVLEAPLKDIVNESDYTKYATATLFNMIINNDKCSECIYFKVCTGGCPALGLLYSGEAHNYFHEDITKCYFFENGWYEKVTNALSGWNIETPLILD